MKKMTTEEKLAYCIKFIEKVNRLPFQKYDIEDFVVVSGHCRDCDSDDICVDFTGTTDLYDPKDIESLKDEAWHVMADIMD